MVFLSCDQQQKKTPKKRGRKPVPIKWPDKEFTAREVHNKMRKKISRVSVHSKINQAVKAGEILLVRTTKPKMGRPHSVYTKCKGKS